MTFNRVGHIQNKKGLLFSENTLTERSSCLSFTPLSNKNLRFSRRGENERKKTHNVIFFLNREDMTTYISDELKIK